MRSYSPFPDPAAVHPGESALLSAVLANLTDDLPKLVYADWLEERNDPRGVFLRAFTTAARNGAELPHAGDFLKPWLDLIGFTAVTAARVHGLPITPDELLKGSLPAITFKSEPAADADTLIGQSKFGGEPDVPPGFVWPEYRGRQLSFLAQFNLLRLSVSSACRELPPSGLLSVFYAEDADVFGMPDMGGWRVFYFPDIGRLARPGSPPDVVEHHYFNPTRLTFTETLTLPSDGGFDSDDHAYTYQEHVRNTPLGHRLIGYTGWLQGDRWPHDVRHLLTIDTDENPGWMWGDSGLLYFGIPADDLTAGRFDRTLFEMQC